MIILLYWQHVSKHYLLLHLLLGVFAAGLGLSLNTDGPSLPACNTPNGYLTSTVSEGVSSLTYSHNIYHSIFASSLIALRSKIPSDKARFVRLSLINMLLYADFIEPYAIRAGPLSDAYA